MRARAFLLLSTLAGGLAPAISIAQELEGREDVIAAAPDDISPEDVGRLYTRDFRPLVGGTNSVLPGNGQGIRQPQRRGITERQLRQVESDFELRANAQVWGLGGASLGAAAQNRHAFYRAIAIETLHEIDPRFGIPPVPAGAEWYISAVYVGRLFEVHFSSNRGSLRGQITASMLSGGGSIEGFAQERQLEFHARTVGLEPRGGNALFASSTAEMAQRYVETGPPQTILVRYSRVPRSARPLADASRPRRVTLVSVQFPDRNPARNTAWDALSGRPDIQVRVL